MKKLFALAVAGVLLAPSAAVFAQESPKDSMDFTALCEAMVTRSSERLMANETRHANNVERMNSSITKLEELVEKAGALGLDTSALETDIENLEAVLSELASDQLAVQNQLTTMSQVDCSTITDDEYQGYLATARSLFDEVKANLSTIKEIRQSVKTHAQEIFDAIQSLLDTQASS